MNAVPERHEDSLPVAYLHECEPTLLDFEPSMAPPRRRFPTLLTVTLALVALGSTASAIILLLRI